MIPLDPSKPILIKAEKDGVNYLMRVLTEDREDEYTEICKLYKDGDEQSNKKYAESIIDFFVVGWSGNNIPVFPTDGKPSKFFVNTTMKIAMVNFVLDNIDKLKGVETDEIKN